MAIAPRYPLADDVARYVGQPVAAVVAATRRQAQDAAEQVAVEYEELPRVTDARRAIEPGAPQIWPDAPGNVCAESRFGDPAAVDAAIAGAAHVVKVSLHNQRLAAFPLEPRAAIATHADGRTTLYTQTQQPTGTRDLLGATFGAKPDTFRIVNGDIGGGFGMKTGLMPEEALICYAARKLGARCDGAPTAARISWRRTWAATSTSTQRSRSTRKAASSPCARGSSATSAVMPWGRQP